ncbi:E3 UFM1-protein ligase 1 [Clonorchis sinensis]|uniref:E3 UFM1-protein ligase 1 n=1 Tax=Clonorchis sinensis TaxID=79923 RepID=G7Y3X3_CLOSI|nr:E3 UFM1-protein ligase 1 [Clonorchis sinensis]
MATWAEVRELAAKLKTTQDKSSALRLSERTWVDIVKYLTSTNRLKLIFTTDGRSYLTREELQKEIREEVEAHNGRVTLMELASNLDVDPLIVEARLSEMVVADAQSKCADRLISIPGEVISESYVRRVAHEIQDRLEERGEVTIGELATVFGLPTAFLVNILNDYQGLLFRVQKYGEKYITDTFMAKNRAMVRGYFTAIMRPVTLSSAASKLNVPENLLSGIVGSLIANGQLCGSLVAGRGTYVPTCYSLAEDSYVRAFYTQNGYVEWTYLKRLGSTDPASYLRSLLPNAVHLSGVSMGPMAIDHLKAVVEEAARDATWADLSHCLPAGLSVKDRIDLVTKHIRKLPLRTVEDGLFVVSEEFVNGCMKHFDKLIHERAELAARENRQNLAASHSRNAASELNAEHAKRSHHTNKGGFGMGAREIKMKNVKKKYLPSKRRQGGGQLEADVDYNCYDVWTSSTESVFAKWISADELNDVLTNALSSELPGEIVSGIVSCLQPQLERSFSNILDSIFVPNSDTARRRETIAQTQEVINSMLFAIQLMERGISGIDRPVLQMQLIRHLVKTHGACLVDRLCVHLAQTYGVQWPTPACSDKPDDQKHSTGATEANSPSPSSPDFVNPMTPDQRQQLVEMLKHSGAADAAQTSSALQNVIEKMRAIQQTASVGLTDYYLAVEALATDYAGISLPTLHARVDNKRKKEERSKANELALQVELQLQTALEALHKEADMRLAATASLAAVCLFAQVATGWPVTAPGKCVPDLVGWLSDFVSSRRSANNSSEATTSPALQALLNSTAIPDLVELTALISQHMHSGIDISLNTELGTKFDQLVNVAKQCRKLMT